MQRFGEHFLASEGNALLAQQMLPKQGELLAGQFISAPKVLPKLRMICMRWRRNTRGLVTYRTFSCSVRNGQVPSGTEQGLLRSSSCSWINSTATTRAKTQPSLEHLELAGTKWVFILLAQLRLSVLPSFTQFCQFWQDQDWKCSHLQPKLPAGNPRANPA